MKINKKLLTIGLVSISFVTVAGLMAYVATDLPTPNISLPEYKVKSRDVQVVGVSENEAVKLSSTEKRKVVESKAIEADFQFNAIAPHWKENNASEESRKLEIRTSMDNEAWGPWFEVEAVGPLRDDDPHPDRQYAETPLFADGQYFQYKITLERDSTKVPSPELYDLKINHIDSRKPKSVVILEKVKNFFGGKKAYASQNHPRIITRSQWGSPDPGGLLFKGTSRYWPISSSPVKQVFLHHTVTPSYQADPSAAVRAIWDFHANTRGWGDIGYNYLIDHQGNVYEGRLGGDNSVGGHVLSYNAGSLGVAMLGCFESTSDVCRNLNGGKVPGTSAKVQASLVNLLGNKTASFEINPNTKHVFCNSKNENCLNLWTIAGHRDANNTSCPGDLTAQSLKNIRDNTVAKKNGGWNYSAKQESYGAVNLSSSATADVTIRFKNTGTKTWSNTTNRTTLYTMESPGRNSVFRGSGWLSGSKPAVLNQANVSPGETGSFTFNMKRPSIKPGVYTEGLTLITGDGNTPGAHYSLVVDTRCSVGQASNPRANGVLIRDTRNGRIYVIEKGKKRHILSTLAAKTNGFKLEERVDVSASEIGVLEDGAAINIREGTLIKSPNDSRVYILDQTLSGYVRRWVSSLATMDAFGMKKDQIHVVTSTTVNGYPEGEAVNAGSVVPDGLLVKSSNDHSIYLTSEGSKQRIPSMTVFGSYNFVTTNIGTVNKERITGLPSGSNLNLRNGTLIKGMGSPNVYAVDVVDGSKQRRRVSSVSAFDASGFQAAYIKTISTEALNEYSDAANIECY